MWHECREEGNIFLNITNMICNAKLGLSSANYLFHCSFPVFYTGKYIIKLINIFAPPPFLSKMIFFSPKYSNNFLFSPFFHILPLIFAFFLINHHFLSPNLKKLIFFLGGGAKWKLYTPASILLIYLAV